MNFLFLYSNLGIGGVQTLILRMAKWLSENGHTVHVCVANKGRDGWTVFPELERYAHVDILGVRGYQSLQISIISRHFFKNRNYDFIHAFDPIGLWIAALQSRDTGSRFVTGIYHPEYYQFRVTTLGGSYYPSEYEKLISLLPDNAFLFMNEATLEAHKHYYKRPFAHSFIMPLPIEDFSGKSAYHQFDQSRMVAHRRGLRRILSVGRFVDFKRYPLGVMDAIFRLRREGYDVVYELYGTGPLEKEFQEYAKSNGYLDFVQFKGSLPYAHFAPRVTEAFAFTGMGTAAIEAAILGVPTLVMPAYSDGNTTYGYLHEQVGFNVGEAGEPRSTFEVLQALCDLNVDEILGLRKLERKAALQFAVTNIMPNYLNIMNSSCVLSPDFELPNIETVFFKKVLRRLSVTPPNWRAGLLSG